MGAALVAVLLLAGCPEEGGQRAEALRVATAGDALTLDPAAASDSESMQVVIQIFDQLVRYKPGTNQVEPALATRWSVSGDGTLWTFHLRRGVRFHDGTPFNADAVVFSFERQRDHTHPFHFGDFTYWESSFRQIEKVEKIGPYTVQITLERPFAPFLANLALFPASIVSPTAMRRLGRRFASEPVGTGPYRFVSWSRGRRITLARNSSYWDRPPHTAHLMFEVVREAGRQLTGLQSGTLDVAYGLAPADRHIVKLHPDLRMFEVPGNNVAYVAMNTQRPPFDDVRVRRAFNLAVDRRAIVKLAYQGLAAEAHGPLPPDMWSHHPNIRRYPYNPTLARKELEEAGYDFSRRISFHVMSSSRPYLPEPMLVGRMVARHLAMVGVKVDLVTRPWKEHQRATRMGEHDMCLAGWFGDNGDPDNFLYVLLDRDNARRGAARNLAMFTNEELHRLLVAAQESRRREDRERHYRKAQEIVAQMAPWIPLAHADVLVGARRTVRDLQIYPSTAIYYRGAVKAHP